MSSVHQEADISRRERREQTEKSQCWCEVTITQNKLCSYVIRPLPVREIIKGYDSPILFPYPPICCNSSYVYILKPSHSLTQEEQRNRFRKSLWGLKKISKISLNIFFEYIFIYEMFRCFLVLNGLLSFG